MNHKELKEKYKKIDRIQKIDAWIFVISLIIFVPLDLINHFSKDEALVDRVLTYIIILYFILGITMLIFVILDIKLKKISEKTLVIDERVEDDKKGLIP